MACCFADVCHNFIIAIVNAIAITIILVALFTNNWATGTDSTKQISIGLRLVSATGSSSTVPIDSYQPTFGSHNFETAGLIAFCLGLAGVGTLGVATLLLIVVCAKRGLRPIASLCGIIGSLAIWGGIVAWFIDADFIHSGFELSWSFYIAILAGLLGMFGGICICCVWFKKKAQGAVNDCC